MTETGRPRIAIFAPHPLLSVTIEQEGAEREDIHFHAAGQGVWAARMAGCMGAHPVLCGFIGGESGRLLGGLLEQLPGERRLTPTAASSGCYVTDRRSGERKVLSCVTSDPPSRHELDALTSATCVEAMRDHWLLVTNPFPGDSLPLECYGDLIGDAKAGGCRTLVDLSIPRLQSALRGMPDLVKLNDWELAEFVDGPVSEPGQLRAAAQQICDMGAKAVIVTRGELPGLAVAGDRAWRLTSPRFEHGYREGCGDAMFGALAASWAQGDGFEQALKVGAAAGAANFLRRGLGGASRDVVEQLIDSVTLEPLTTAC